MVARQCKPFGGEKLGNDGHDSGGRGVVQDGNRVLHVQRDGEIKFCLGYFLNGPIPASYRLFSFFHMTQLNINL